MTRIVEHSLSWWRGTATTWGSGCYIICLSCGRSIECNPLEAGIVVQPWDYDWSSARVHATGAADPLVTECAEYHESASEAQDREERWRGFLLREDPREQAVRRGDWVIGDDAFRLQVSQARGRPAPRGRGRPRKSSKPGQVQFSP